MFRGLAVAGVIVAGFAQTPAIAQIGQPSMANQAQREARCILDNTRRTTSAAARRLIAQACNFLSLSTVNMELNKRERSFNECLISNLPGVEDDGNASDVVRACRTLSWP